ncbi:MAG: acetate--CoA ligase family protein [Nocardiopsaceae bacterium]|nr:acetate--CoA ligase family protein [Nocardiopsaceae bacterium]
MTQTRLDGLAAVFTPRRIALVGASDRPGTLGRLLWDNLAAFGGEVVPVSRADRVGGQVAYPDLRKVPGPVDLAVIGTPAGAVPEIVQAAADKGVAAAIVLSAGFAETGADGARLQAETLSIARAGGVRLVGPNCFGVQNADLSLNASIAAGLPRGGGGVTIVTQSGSYGMAVHALGEDEGLRVAKVFAAGNKADISDAELLAYLREDPGTSVICLILESITEARRFFAEASETTRRKPVIAVVGGRTGAGRRAALSHTAALATDDAVRDAALRQAGVVRVRTGLQVLDAARALSSQPVPRGARAAVITNSGGTGVELTDLLADEGLSVPELSAPLREKLLAIMPGYASARNPVDMTPAWHLFTTVYPAAIDLLARSGEVDVIVPVLLQRSASAEVAAAVRDAVARLRADGVPVPVYVCWVAPKAAEEHTAILQDAGVPCFPWPERTARVAGLAVRCGRELRRPVPADSVPADPVPADSVPADPVPAVPGPRPVFPRSPRAGRAASRDGWLTSADAGELLAAAGIPLAETVRCPTPADAAAAAERLGYPVVVKVDHPDLTHKSDVAGVRLGLMSADAVADAAASMLRLAPGAAATVSRQYRGVELLAGGVRDPEFGPMVMTGLGGILVEAQRDVRLAVAPVDAGYAEAMLRSLRGAAVLDGPRGSPPADIASVARLVAAVSAVMAGHTEIGELDLNPVLAGPDGCVAVDWRIRICAPTREA